MSIYISWLSLIVSVFSVSIGQIRYKIFSQRKKFLFLFIAISGIGLAQITNYIALLSIDVGVVYMFMGINQVLVLLGSVYILKEEICQSQIIAIIIIISGIILYGSNYSF